MLIKEPMIVLNSLLPKSALKDCHSQQKVLNFWTILLLILLCLLNLEVCDSTSSPSMVPSSPPSAAPSSATPSTPPVAAPVSYLIAAFAGTGSTGSTGNGGPASAASVYYPYGIWMDSSGVMYIAEYYGNSVRKVAINGIISEYIAGGGSSAGNGGPVTSATVLGPSGVWGSSLGDVYVVETDSNRVRVVSANGIIDAFAGTGEVGGSDSWYVGAATSMQFNGAVNIGGDSTGTVYIVDLNYCKIRKVVSGIISTFAGNGVCTYSGDSVAATSTSLNSPNSVHASSVGSVYIADSGNNRIRQVTTSNLAISTTIGTGSASFNGDGRSATSTSIAYPASFWGGTTLPYFVADSGNNRVRLLASGSLMYTVAGTGAIGTSSSSGFATASSLTNPACVTGNTLGDAYVSEQSGNVVRHLVNLNPTVTPTLAPSYSRVPSLPPVASPVTYMISVLAGVAGSQATSVSSGSSYSAKLNYPTGISQDTMGTIYFAEYSWSVIRKIDASNIVSTFAGSFDYTGSVFGDGGPATDAGLLTARDVFADSLGQVYVLDQDVSQIRLVNSGGIIFLFAGTGETTTSTTDSNGDGGAPTAARLNGPGGIYGDSIGNIYLSDTFSFKLRRISSNVIQTVMGTGVSGFSGDFVTPTSAQLAIPMGVCTDSTGGVYVADYGNNIVFWISYSTQYYAGIKFGTGVTGYEGDGVTSSALNGPIDVWTDNIGNVFIVDSKNYRIRFVKSNNLKIYTIAGTGVPGYSGDGGPGSSAMMDAVDSIVGNTDGLIYITDYGSYTIRRLSYHLPTEQPSAVPSAGPSTKPTVQPSIEPSYAPVAAPTAFLISAYAGGSYGYAGDGGAATAAKMGTPAGMWFSSGTLYVADTTNNVIRTVSSGIINALAGVYGQTSNIGNGGAATSACLKLPTGVYVDIVGNVFISEFNRHVVRRVYGSTISAYAGVNDVASSLSTDANGDLGPASSATLNCPFGIAGDTSGNMYIADMNNYKIRAITGGGMIYTVIGNGVPGDSSNSCNGVQCSLSSPSGIFADSVGYLYIAEHDYRRLYRFSLSTNIMSVFAGLGAILSNTFNGDGIAATSANIVGSYSQWVSSTGRVYFADYNGCRIRMIDSSSKIVYTIAGNGDYTNTGDGGPASSATVKAPDSIVGDTNGDLYYSDDYESIIRKLTNLAPTSLPSISPTSCAPTRSPTILPTMKPSTTCPSVQPTTAAPTYTPVSAPVSYKVSLYAGRAYASPSDNSDLGPVTSVAFSTPYSIWKNSAALYVTDPGSAVVRKISTISNIVTAFAGLYGSSFGVVNGIAASSADLYEPYGVVGDSLGQIYFSDGGFQVVRRVNSGGIIDAFAGTGTPSGGSNGDDGDATSATLILPYGLAIDTVGNVFIADQNSRIRKVIASSNTITSAVGNGFSTAIVDGTPATAFGVSIPVGVFVDSVSGMYFTDIGYSFIFRVDTATQKVYKVVGNSASFNGDGLAATSTSINTPREFWQDTTGASYFSDSLNCRIRMISSAGFVYTIVGTGSKGYTGDNGPGTSAAIADPSAGLVDYSFAIYFCDRGSSTIRKLTNITPTSIPSLTPSLSPSNEPSIVPTITPTVLPSVQPTLLPTTLVPSVNPSIAPTFKTFIAPLSFVVSNLAGQSGVRTTSGFDIQATAAAFFYPAGVWVDSIEQTYIAERQDCLIRKVTSDGIITNFAGTQGLTSTSGDSGRATSAAINTPMKAWGDSMDSVYIVAAGSHAVRQVSVISSIITAYAGIYIASTDPSNANGDGGRASSASLSNPSDICGDSVGGLYIADAGNNKIRKVDASNIISTLAGTGNLGVTGDGWAASSADISYTYSIFVDSSGSCYIALSDNAVMRRVDGITKIITTFAGTGGTAYNGDGNAATSTGLFSPQGLSGDTTGNIFFSDYNHYRIRMIENAIVFTVAGTGTLSSTGDGGAATSATMWPYYTWNDNGNVVFSDVGGYTVRKLWNTNPTVAPSAVPTTYAPTQAPSYAVVIAPSSFIIDSFAGVDGSPTESGDNGKATSAGFFSVFGVWSSGTEALIADGVGSKIRKVSSSNIITTYAGVGVNSGTTSDGVAATNAYLNFPVKAYKNTDGDVFVLTKDENKIFYFSHSQSVQITYAGTGIASADSTDSNGDGGLATAATFKNSYDMTGDSSYNLYVADYGDHRIRKIDANNIITTIAGTGYANIFYTEGGATSIDVGYPISVFVSSLGDVYYIANSDYNRVRKIDIVAAYTRTIAGTGISSFNGEGFPSTSSNINYPRGLSGDTSGSVYFSDYANFRFRMTSSNGNMYTIAGTGVGSATGNGGPASAATLQVYYSWCDETGNIIISDLQSNSIRKLYNLNPTMAPTLSIAPSVNPTVSPSQIPTYLPTSQPSGQPSDCPSVDPSSQPTDQPSLQPMAMPSGQPSVKPSEQPTRQPSSQPSRQPSSFPSSQPSCHPTSQPSIQPTSQPTRQPTRQPSVVPSSRPSGQPSVQPTIQPSTIPASKPSQPSSVPSGRPSGQPTRQPTVQPTALPTDQPSVQPSGRPLSHPSSQPSSQPSVTPTNNPSRLPSAQPSKQPATRPSGQPSREPSSQPSTSPSRHPSSQPSAAPSRQPSNQPTKQPLSRPSAQPSSGPSHQPTCQPTRQPSLQPSVRPSNQPSRQPSGQPTMQPSIQPSCQPRGSPSSHPSLTPSSNPSVYPTSQPSVSPTVVPSMAPSSRPSRWPSGCPSSHPSVCPSALPSRQPSMQPTNQPSSKPTGRPSRQPAGKPSSQPTNQPLVCPSGQPSRQPVRRPSSRPSNQPSSQPSGQPRSRPSGVPSQQPSGFPSSSPTTASFHQTQPKSTLPVGTSFSVTGPANGTVRIVLPFLQVTPVIGMALNSIVLSASGSYGANYVIFGRQRMPSVVSVTDSGVYSLSNTVDSDFSGRSVSVIIDFNGDGYNDLVVGDPFSAKCYVLFGTRNGFSNMTDGFTIFGEADSDLTGWSVSDAGDVNNDTMHDLIVGAPNADSMGAVYVIYGRRTQLFDVYLTNLTSTHGFALYASSRSDNLGISVSGAGDVNHDGCDDVVAGATLMSSYYYGAVYVLYGGPSLLTMTTSSISASQGFKITGPGFSVLGYSVSSVGDVNNDGIDDLLVGSSPQKPNVASSAYVIYGAKSQLSSLMAASLSVTQGFRIAGGGMVVGSVGDVNRDGVSDVLIGSSYGFNDHCGFVLHTKVGYVASPTVTPSFAPTATRTPTVIRTSSPSKGPSVKPSLNPSMFPTQAPTSPTFEPTMGATEPTSHPSFAPSRPTTAPSEAPVLPSIAPTYEPSDSPSVVPTHEPSEIPTMLPTLISTANPSLLPSTKPSITQTEAPTVFQLSRRPFLLPTTAPSLWPTAASFENVVIADKDTTITQPVLVYNRSEVNYHFIVNTSTNVYIAMVGGRDRFSVYRHANVTLTIAFFNTSSDIINLVAFAPAIASFDDLSIIAGSAIISLPQAQAIHILNLHPVDLKPNHFEFGASANGSGGNGKFEKIVTIVSLSVGSLFAAVCLFLFVSHKLAEKKFEMECDQLVVDMMKRREDLALLNKNTQNRRSVCILQFTSVPGKNGRLRRRLISWDGVDDVGSDFESVQSDDEIQRIDSDSNVRARIVQRRWNNSFDSAYEEEFAVSDDSDLSYEYRRGLNVDIVVGEAISTRGYIPAWDDQHSERFTASALGANSSNYPSSSIWSITDNGGLEHFYSNSDNENVGMPYDIGQHHHEDHEDHIDTIINENHEYPEGSEHYSHHQRTSRSRVASSEFDVERGFGIWNYASSAYSDSGMYYEGHLYSTGGILNADHQRDGDCDYLAQWDEV